MLSLAQAAKAAGKSKQTLVRWIKSGKLSATRNDDGSYEIDPAELARISHGPAVTPGPMLQLGPPNGAGPGPMISAGEIEGLHMLLREREEVIRDLRARLDTATAQLGEALQQVRLLTDQRQPARRSWWRLGR